MVIRFISCGEELLYIRDTVLHPIHLEHVDWVPVYVFLLRKQTLSKKKIFDYAAMQPAFVVGQHFLTFPSLGYVEKKENGWKYIPVTLL